MNRLRIALAMAAALCAGCMATPWTAPTPTPSPGPGTISSSLPGKPRHCLSYPDPAVCRALHCDASDKTADYQECLHQRGRCDSIPAECR